MLLKRYFTLPRVPELKPIHQIQFNVITMTPPFGDSLVLFREYSQHMLNSANTANRSANATDIDVQS